MSKEGGRSLGQSLKEVRPPSPAGSFMKHIIIDFPYRFFLFVFLTSKGTAGQSLPLALRLGGQGPFSSASSCLTCRWASTCQQHPACGGKLISSTCVILTTKLKRAPVFSCGELCHHVPGKALVRAEERGCWLGSGVRFLLFPLCHAGAELRCQAGLPKRQ